MTDIVPQHVRSRMMSRIRSSDTRPERAVRKFIHAAGLRYRLHHGTLPGRPDLVLPKYKSVVFVHGCFWHRHEGCPYAYCPKSNDAFWSTKFENNVRRDARQVELLRGLGWNVFVIWECTAETPGVLQRVVEEIRALAPSPAATQIPPLVATAKSSTEVLRVAIG